ncbi:MAG TPA: hypothetical protein PKO41_04190 [Dokdonella sp.]|nr:hypothetical protein [Dokdonella sp.]
MNRRHTDNMVSPLTEALLLLAGMAIAIAVGMLVDWIARGAS